MPFATYWPFLCGHNALKSESAFYSVPHHSICEYGHQITILWAINMENNHLNAFRYDSTHWFHTNSCFSKSLRPSLKFALSYHDKRHTQHTTCAWYWFKNINRTSTASRFNFYTPTFIFGDASRTVLNESFITLTRTTVWAWQSHAESILTEQAKLQDNFHG